MRDALLIVLDVALWAGGGFWLLSLTAAMMSDGPPPTGWWVTFFWGAPLSILCAIGLLIWIVVQAIRGG
jgi:hypothetical protein